MEAKISLTCSSSETLMVRHAAEFRSRLAPGRDYRCGDGPHSVGRLKVHDTGRALDFLLARQTTRH